MALESQE